MSSNHLLSFIERTSGDLIEEGKKEGKLIGIGEGVEIGKKEGNEEKAISVAKWMLKKDMLIEDIQEATGLPIEKINILKEK